MTIDLTRPEFPRASRYDPAWMLEHNMGPNPLWLAEWLCQALDLRPGMRVLDLGCGKALTSIFLAKEFGVQVWAADLWVGPDANWARAAAAGVQDRVFPMHLEAHALPFAAGFFDAVVSIDAYQYFGTDELYLHYLARFVRPGGTLAVAVPGLARAFEAVPAHLTSPQANGKVFWEDECHAYKTADWWRQLWSRCGAVTDVRAELQPDGWRHWRDFEKALEASGEGLFPSDVEAIERDAGQTLGFVRALARRTERGAANLYDPALGKSAGFDP